MSLLLLLLLLLFFIFLLFVLCCCLVEIVHVSHYPVSTVDLKAVVRSAAEERSCTFAIASDCPLRTTRTSSRHGASSGVGWRNGLQILRIAANILNKQSQTANRGWSSAWGLSDVLTTPLHKNLTMLRTIKKSLGTGLILRYNLSRAQGTGGVWIDQGHLRQLSGN